MAAPNPARIRFLGQRDNAALGVLDEARRAFAGRRPQAPKADLIDVGFAGPLASGSWRE
jgi:hypothetical protein